MRILTGIGVLLFAFGLTGCGDVPPTQPQLRVILPPVTPPTQGSLVVFRESSSGFSTSDVHDAQGDIVQFTSAGEIIWTADGTHFKGHAGDGPIHAFCQCWFDVRFGTSGGERHAYLTADYGHDNPGTVVDLEVVGGVLVMTQTTMYPPGSYTLSGVVTTMTGGGPEALEGADVYFIVGGIVGGGWRAARTDKDGAYKIQGLYDSSPEVSAQKEGYLTQTRVVSIGGDTRLDIQLIRR